MATARPSNLKRAEWNRKCRQKLSAHIHSRLGILVELSQVRLKPTVDDPYTWERVKEKEHLFLKNISDHSNRSLIELYEGVGVSFAAIGMNSIREIQTESAQGKVGSIYINFSQMLKLIEMWYLCSPKTGVSFTAKIDELQKSEARLICELNKCRNQVTIELEMRRQAEEKVNHLQTAIKELQKGNLMLEEQIQEWKIIAEQSQSNVIKYSDGMSRFSVLLAELKSELSLN
ncbi:hypothetical protein BDZ45DRAFT_607604 [Acephala macrosclerotiorum]|nr:hypothetical protein BDZ45DRAFT_607604 [Acephala macrosclerotiorum]